MPENRQDGAASSAPIDKLEESLGRVSIAGKQEEGAGVDRGGSAAPDHPEKPDCMHYLRTGTCAYGANCRYNHPPNAWQGYLSKDNDLPERAGQPDCQHFLRTGNCKFGTTCKYNHPQKRGDSGQIPVNTLGLPMRQEEKSCPYYMKTGFCKFGISCKFNHPQPGSLGAVFHLPGPSAYASGSSSYTSPGSLAIPSSGLPLMGGVASWSLPRHPYLPTSTISGVPSYVPVVLPPSQGPIPVQQGWNTYTGTISPVSSSDASAPAQVPNSNSQRQFSSTTPVLFPDRPNQPDCQYFMKNGSCKYGPSCKYHHPKDRIMAATSYTVGPLGLPLRPGQAVCSFYSAYGRCKYGLGCKFDHPPFTGYYNYAFPALSVPDPSYLFHYQSSSPVFWTPSEVSSEASRLPESHMKSDGKNSKIESVDASVLEDAPPQPSPSPTAPSSDSPQDQSD